MKLRSLWMQDEDPTWLAASKLIGWILLGALILAGVVALLTDDPANPAENEHARACIYDRRGEIRTHDQFGGKYSRTTYWCVDRDGRILDLWFDS